MPIGIMLNALVIVAGGLIGAFSGDRLSDHFKENLNTVFGACAMAMGISSIVLMENMPAVIFAVIAGTSAGLMIHLGQWINRAGAAMQNRISKLQKTSNQGKDNAGDLLVTVLVLFCASGTGIYGSIVSGMTNEHTILIAKSILDFPTALIFACTLGSVVSLVAVPQFIIFFSLFYLLKQFILCVPRQ